MPRKSGMKIPKLDEQPTADFIERVRAEPVLWDNTHADYFNREKTDPKWVEIMEAMMIEGHTRKLVEK